MKRYEVPVQPNGRMILPADLRRDLQLGEGGRVVLQKVGDRIEITTARLSRAQARARVRARLPEAADVVDGFSDERRAEARREVAGWAGQDIEGPPSEGEDIPAFDHSDTKR